MAYINTLPNELLLDTLERLQASPSSLSKATRCCKRWHPLASSVLYNHISLDAGLREDSAVSRLARQSTQCNNIQSFAVRVTQTLLMGFSIQSAEAFDRLSELCDLLSSMQRLTTFSLTFEEPIGHGFPAPSAFVYSTLKALPITLVNLNLDCENLAIDSLEESHACHAVSTLIPRLKSLRLRTSHLCSGLLSSLGSQVTLDPQRSSRPRAASNPKATSSLEYIVIRLDTLPNPAHGSHTCLCYSRAESVHGATMARTLQDLYIQGALPRLQRFAVIGRIDAPPSPRNDHWSVFKVRDWRQGVISTTTFPWCARGGSSSLFMIRDGQDDWFGSLTSIIDSLEGSLSWSRFGLAKRPYSEFAREGVWALDHGRLTRRHFVTQKFGVCFRLWKHEDATGMKLLDVRTSADFDDTEAMTQTLPLGWEWVAGDSWTWTIQPITE